MKTLAALLLLFCFPSLKAIEFSPWFSPLWEFQTKTTVAADHNSFVKTPEGDFKSPSENIYLHLHLGITPWPFWNVEVELALTHTPKIDFAYEATRLVARYLWLDDVAGDPFSLYSAVMLSLPGSRFIENIDFLYPGHANFEGQVCLGKEWCSKKCVDHYSRIWSLLGYGVAEQGSPWLHALFSWEKQHAIGIKASTQFFYGFGNNNIFPTLPFKGFALIAYRSLDLIGEISIPFFFSGKLQGYGWYNVYAYNFQKNYYGFGLAFSSSFGI